MVTRQSDQVKASEAKAEGMTVGKDNFAKISEVEERERLRELKAKQLAAQDKAIHAKMVKADKLDVPHPGEFLRTAMHQQGLDDNAQAEEDCSIKLGLGPDQFRDVLNCSAPITTEIAAKVEKHWGIPADLLLRQQKAHDAAS